MKPKGDIFTSKCNEYYLNCDRASPYDQPKIMLNWDKCKINYKLVPGLIYP